MSQRIAIIDEAVLDIFRRKKFCELCRKYFRDGLHPHHVFERGMGGWRRFDVEINLCGLCWKCHGLYHSGKIERAAILAVVAAREGLTAQVLEEKILALRRGER